MSPPASGSRLVAPPSVDWLERLRGAAAAPVSQRSARGEELATLLVQLDELVAADNVDQMLRCAAEIARKGVGLERVGIFLLDDAKQRMLGSWGSDIGGRIVDEHHVAFDCDERLAAVFQRAESEGELFSVFENCPSVLQREDAGPAAKSGWVACTPIRSGRERIGLMFNDAGLSAAPVDPAQQERAALVCSFLASAIALIRVKHGYHWAMRREPAQHPVARKAIEMLAEDPALTGKEIAIRLGISISQLVRLFKAHVGLSLVDYRNRLRIERFQTLVSSGEDKLREVARAAGFGSYAQFHRVFRATYGKAPSSYLRAR